jgi:hypothetical protein
MSLYDHASRGMSKTNLFYYFNQFIGDNAIKINKSHEGNGQFRIFMGLKSFNYKAQLKYIVVFYPC